MSKIEFLTLIAVAMGSFAAGFSIASLQTIKALRSWGRSTKEWAAEYRAMSLRWRDYCAQLERQIANEGEEWKGR